MLGMGLGGCGRGSVEKLDSETDSVKKSEAGDVKKSGEGEEEMQPVVQLSAEGLEGSGIIWKQTQEQLVVVTAAHVVEGIKEPVKVKLGETFEVEGDSVFISETSDLAFVSIDVTSSMAEQMEAWGAVSTDKEGFDKMQAGAEVIFKGASSTEQSGVLKEAWIYVEDFSQYMMLLEGEIQPGMSGGAVFDENGALVGMLCGANEKGEVAAVPLSIIMSEYALFY